jgi:hypothetical protein
MKKILLVLMIFIVKTSFAQKDTTGLNIPTKDQKIVYEAVVEIPNKNKLDLYNNAQKWFIDKFNSSKDVIQNQDKEQGQIVGKGIMTTTIKGRMGTPWNFKNRVTVQIDCKDNKYRYRIYDIITSLPDGGISETSLEVPFNSLTNGKWVVSEKYTRSLIENTNTDIKALVSSLKIAMDAKKDDF